MDNIISFHYTTKKLTEQAPKLKSP